MFKILSLALSISLLPSTVLATGLSVSPSRLDFEMASDEQTSQTLTVINPTADVMVFEIYPDEFESVISANPESFTLESGGRKEVPISVDAGSPSFQKRGSGGVISTNLSVIGTPLAENKINLGAGAKIPVTIKIIDGKQPGANKTALIIILGASLLSAAFYLGRRTKQP